MKNFFYIACYFCFQDVTAIIEVAYILKQRCKRHLSLPLWEKY